MSINAPSSSKGLYIILLLSIAANIFVIGYLFGYIPHTSEIGLSASPMAHEMTGAFKNLPTENHKELTNFIKSQQQQINANLQEIVKLRLEIAKLISQDQFDPDQLAKLFDQMTALSSRNITLSQQSVYQTILQLSKEERLKIAKALEASVKQQSQAPKPTPPKIS